MPRLPSHIDKSALKDEAFNLFMELDEVQYNSDRDELIANFKHPWFDHSLSSILQTMRGDEPQSEVAQAIVNRIKANDVAHYYPQWQLPSPSPGSLAVQAQASLGNRDPSILYDRFYRDRYLNEGFYPVSQPVVANAAYPPHSAPHQYAMDPSRGNVYQHNAKDLVPIANPYHYANQHGYYQSADVYYQPGHVNYQYGQYPSEPGSSQQSYPPARR